MKSRIKIKICHRHDHESRQSLTSRYLWANSSGQQSVPSTQPGAVARRMTEPGYPSAVNRTDVTGRPSRLVRATRATACSAIALLIARRKDRACNPHGLRRRSSNCTRPRVVSGNAETRESGVWSAFERVTAVQNRSCVAYACPDSAATFVVHLKQLDKPLYKWLRMFRFWIKN